MFPYEDNVTSLFQKLCEKSQSFSLRSKINEFISLNKTIKIYLRPLFVQTRTCLIATWHIILVTFLGKLEVTSDFSKNEF